MGLMSYSSPLDTLVCIRYQPDLTVGSLDVVRADHKAAVFCVPCSDRQH